MQLPHAPAALAALLPDVPRWIGTRALLLSGNALLEVSDDGVAGVVMDTTLPSGAVVGHADRVFLQDVLAGVPRDFELVVQIEEVHAAREALPDWAVSQVIVHSPSRPYPGGNRRRPGVVISAPPDDRWLNGLPEDIRRYAALAEPIGVRVVDGAVVAVCAASEVTETLWDVGIDTLDAHRRRGHAVACFDALAEWMAGRGRQPVWCAYEDYPPSRSLATKLGFQPVDRIAVLSPGAGTLL